MKNELFSLAIQRIRGTKRNSLLLGIILLCSFAFTVITLGITDSLNETNAQYRLDTYGSWKTTVYNSTEEDKEILEENPLSKQVGTLLSYGNIGGSDTIGTPDKALIEMGNLELLEGHFPEKSGEIAMEASLLSALGYDYELNQKIVVNFQKDVETWVEAEFTLCGVLKQYSHLWNCEENISLPAAFIVKEDGEKLQPFPAYHYFVTSEEEQETLTGSIRSTLGKKENENLKIVGNTFAYNSLSEKADYYLYLVLILLTTVLAVACVYFVQMQEQLRSIALFRSIGGTKKQLIGLLFYETMCMVVPCICLGTIIGSAGLWGIFKVFINVSFTDFRISIPIFGFLVVTLLWLGSIFFCRLLVLYLAMKQPLTGKITMSGKMGKRYRSIKKASLTLLAGMFSTVMLFVMMESIPEFFEKRWAEKESSYRIDAAEKTISEEEVKVLEELPGITKVLPHGEMVGELSFDNMKKVPLASACKENKNKNQPIFMEQQNADGTMEYICFPQGIGVRVIGIQKEYWKDYFDTDISGFDEKAFEEGKTALVTFVTEDDGKITFDGTVYEDTGLEKGDIINLRFYDRNSEDFQNPSLASEHSLKLAAQPVKRKLREGAGKGYIGSYGAHYNILVSVNFMQKVLDESKDAEVSSHYTGGNIYGDSNAEIYTSVNAKYLSTDYLVAQTAKSYGTTLDNNREEVSAQVLSHLQNLLLICVCGGCIGLTLFLLLWNLITLAARYECRKYGILQAIGMSNKQMYIEILKKGALTGVSSLFLAFFFYGVYFVIREWLKVRYVIENFGDNYTLKEGIQSTYYYLEMCGVSLEVFILFIVAILIFFLILFYWCNRILTKTTLMEKLKQ